MPSKVLQELSRQQSPFTEISDNQRRSATTILGSTAALAIIFFLAINTIAWSLEAGYYFLVLAPSSKSKGVVDKITSAIYRRNALWPHYSVLDHALEEFALLPRAPQVVLLGSSLMFDPFIDLDFTNYPDLAKFIQGVKHHRSLALENRLRELGINGVSTFNLSEGGARFSDNEVIVDTCLNGDRTPACLIIGVSPGSVLGVARAQTPCFKRLVVRPDRIVYYTRKFQIPTTEVWQTFASRLCYLSFYKGYWQSKLTESISDVFNRVIGPPPVVDWTQALSQSYAIGFKTKLDPATVTAQLQSFERLLKICRKRGIKVIAVDMPLGSSHVALLPDRFYEKFNHTVKEIASDNKALFVDLSVSREFADTDFRDQVHLNANGARKFVNLVAQLIAANSTYVTSHSDKMLMVNKGE